MELVYKVHTKHRVSKPTRDASVWDVTPWQEVALFARAGEMKWNSKGKENGKEKNYLWALKDDCSILGRGLENSGKQVQLHIAKFVEDNHAWHGYPVHPRGDDIPPEIVLDDWMRKEFINKAQKLKIIGGQFK